MRRAVFLAAVLTLLALLIGFAFAGSQSALAAGTTVSGVDVGGLSQSEAVRVLTARAAAVERVPITFTAAGESYALSASQLGVSVDWDAAVRDAAAAGGGVAPVRGYRRLQARFFGIDEAPPVAAYDAAVDYKLDQVARDVARSGVDAKLVRKGLDVRVVEGHGGRKLDQVAAAAVVVQSLARLDRGTPVALPLATTPLRVDAADIEEAAAKARIALSGPIRLAYGETRWRIPRWKVASLIELPAAGKTDVAVTGRRSRGVSEAPVRDRLSQAAGRALPGHGDGEDRRAPICAGAAARSARYREGDRGGRVLADQRTAELVVRVAEPARTTADAKTMGITGVVSSYTTTYGGTPGRLSNVQLVSRLIDGTLVAPGGTFSFNDATGERTAEKGFLEAPVIINGEIQNGLGGGVCQVSTTVFNAAYESGLPIVARTNHALYISHYPLGRDATVNYPDLDMRFTNDTGHWLLLRTFVGAGSLTVNLYGTPVNRRVESTTEPLVETGPIPVQETDDPALEKGKRVVDEVGAPPRQTSVRRLVYDANDKLLYDNTWRSFYVGEPSLVRVGTKAPPKKPKKPGAKPAATVEKAGTRATPPTSTTPAGSTKAPVLPATPARP